jgi:lipoteichoic acid synthase
MKNKNQLHVYFYFTGVFFVLNILNTYMLTIQGFNRYIAPFEHTFYGEFNALVGNFVILFIFTLFSFVVFRRAKSRMLFMIFFSLFLNILIFFMGIFNLYFGTSFSMSAATIFQNPAEGFAGGTILEMVLELVAYYRILVFLPTIALLFVYTHSNLKEMAIIKFNPTLKRYLSGFLTAVILLFLAVFNYYKQFERILPLNAVRSTFASQNLGVYPYYLGEFFGEPFDLDIENFLEVSSEDELATMYQEYNKNQESYVNYFDGNTYSNRLTMDQTVDELFIDPSIALGNDLQGILEGRNLVLVHLESFNYFLLQNEYTNDQMPFINQLMEESFTFNNFYNNVGMGVSSDAELSVLTGLYPLGDRTLYWDYEHIDFELNSIVQYFNQDGYYTEAIHGDHEKFYNRDVIYPELMGFDEFYSIEDFILDGYAVKDGYTFDIENNLVHHSPWISDYHLADQTATVGRTLLEENSQFMLFPIMMMAHTPFDYDPYGYREDIYPQYVKLINRITMKYLNYAQYYDETIKRFFVGDQNQDQTLDNSVYIFYSDHGSGLKNGDLDLLMDKNLTVMESRQILQRVFAFIYVPGSEFINYGDYQIRKGLLTGEQNLVRSQVDLYRTIVELFNLPVGMDTYYGVHGLSTEPTFAMENRLMDVVLDSYIFSMRNPSKTYPEDQTVTTEIYDYIVRFKLLSDLMLSKGDMQTRVDEAVLIKYGS